MYIDKNINIYKYMDPIINETQINIILDTGLGEVSLTKDILHNNLLNKSEYSEYPFFSWWIPYPRDVLVKMDYASQVDFFFKKDDFITILKNTYEYGNYSKQMQEKFQKDNYAKNKKNIELIKASNTFLLDKTDRNNNAKNNIMIMLTLLFPTNFPITSNIMNTHDALFLNVVNKSSVSSIIPFLLNISL
jgi:hypothetical protein